MKKQLAALAFFAAAIGATVPSWAFQSVGRSTFTAGLLTGGVRTATATIVIRDVSDPLGSPNRSTVTWSGVSVPSTGWKIADRCFLITSTITDPGGGIQIYTRNKEADAVPQFVDPTPGDTTNGDSNPAGLLKGNTASTTTVTLPLAWTIKSSTRTLECGTDQTGVGAADPNTGPTGSVYNNKFQWKFFKDRATPTIPSTGATAFVDGEPYVTMINVVGIHYGQDNTEFATAAADKKSFVYIEANFAGAAAQQAYQTTTMTVESFIQ
jgi:hypothetical protein